MCRSEHGMLPAPHLRKCYLCQDKKHDFVVKRVIDPLTNKIYQVCNDCIIRLLAPFIAEGLHAE